MAGIYHPNVLTVLLTNEIGAGHRVLNVTNWMGQNNPWTIPQLTSIQTTVNTAMTTSWVPLLSSVNQYTGAVVIDSSAATGLQVDNANYTAVPGTGNAVPIQDQVCCLLSLKQVQRYKGGHSRKYLPGLGLNLLQGDGRTLTPSAVTSIGSWWDGLVTAMAGVTGTNGGPFTPIIWHKKQAGFQNTTQAIVQRTVQSVTATQRRRVRKVSRHRKVI